MKRILFLSVCFLSLLCSLAGCQDFVKSPDQLFITWENSEPDTWASAWLIKKHLNPNAQVEIRPVSSPFRDGVGFAIPDSSYARDGVQSSFEKLLDRLSHEKDPILTKMGHYIHAIEVVPWSANQYRVEADLITAKYRRLQNTFKDQLVPVNCYGVFFDTLYDSIAAQRSAESIDIEAIVSRSECIEGKAVEYGKRSKDAFVKEVPIENILSLISEGKRVVFVDVREAEEYEEARIPNAINLPLRDIGSADLASFENADLIVPYCIKDFRGYEVARKLSSMGLHNVGVMLPHGLAGWRKRNLPIMKMNEVSETDAYHQLKACAENLDCLRGQG